MSRHAAALFVALTMVVMALGGLLFGLLLLCFAVVGLAVSVLAWLFRLPMRVMGRLA